MPKRNRLRQIGFSIATALVALAVCGVAYHTVRVRLCNNAMPLEYASYSSIREVEQTLDDTLTNGPDRLAIDAIWDSYAKMTLGGAAYQEKYELEKDAIAAAVAAQGSDYPYVNDYQGFVQYERYRR